MGWKQTNMPGAQQYMQWETTWGNPWVTGAARIHQFLAIGLPRSTAQAVSALTLVSHSLLRCPSLPMCMETCKHLSWSSHNKINHAHSGQTLPSTNGVGHPLAKMAGVSSQK